MSVLFSLFIIVISNHCSEISNGFVRIFVRRGNFIRRAAHLCEWQDSLGPTSFAVRDRNFHWVLTVLGHISESFKAYIVIFTRYLA
jgi:hypothetical protein